MTIDTPFFATERIKLWDMHRHTRFLRAAWLTDPIDSNGTLSTRAFVRRTDKCYGVEHSMMIKPGCTVYKIIKQLAKHVPACEVEAQLLAVLEFEKAARNGQ